MGGHPEAFDEILWVLFEIRKVEEERARREIGQGKKPRKEQRLTQRMFRVV